MSETLIIRAATIGDVPLIHRFITDLAAYEKLSGQMRATPAMLATSLFGAAPAAEVVIGEYDGVPRGFALFFANYSTFEGRAGLYLEDLFVDPAARGAGLGTAILRWLARLAVARGYPRLEWSVLDWNEPAIRFYRSLGARQMDEWTVHRVDGDALASLAAA